MDPMHGNQPNDDTHSPISQKKNNKSQIRICSCYSTFNSSMAPTPRLVVPIDLTKKPWEQNFPLHNRWHPQLPHVAEVKVGELFRVEMTDWTGGAIKDDDSAVDVKSIDLSTVSIWTWFSLLDGKIPLNDTDTWSPTYTKSLLILGLTYYIYSCYIYCNTRFVLHRKIEFEPYAVGLTYL